MFRKVFYDHLAEDLSDQWRFFLIQGLALLALGVLILVFPELLAVMVALTFFVIGAVFLSLAWRTRRFKGRYERWREEFWEPFEGL